MIFVKLRPFAIGGHFHGLNRVKAPPEGHRSALCPTDAVVLVEFMGGLFRIREVAGSDLSRRPTILTESFGTILPQSLQPNTEIVPTGGHYHFIPHSLQLIIQ